MKRPALIVLGIASVIGLISAGQLFIGRMGDDEPYTPGHAIIMQLPNFYLWALLVPVILWVVKRFKRRILPHVLAAFVISFIHAAILLYFMHVIGHGYPDDHSFWPHMLIEIQYSGLIHLFTYGMILAAIIGWRSYRELRDREVEASQLAEQLAVAQLQALRMQIHPHFLFNALNAVNMLIRADEKTRAVQAVTGISELLRHVIDGEALQEVRLKDEIAFLDRYLNIEAVRFGDRLHVEKQIDAGVGNALVPNLILQPIVENAIRHGISEKRESGRIDISATRVNGKLLIEVKDDGVGIGKAHEERIGLSNTRARLQKLYGGEGGLTVEANPNGGTTATVTIPFRI